MDALLEIFHEWAKAVLKLFLNVFLVVFVLLYEIVERLRKASTRLYKGQG